MFNTNLRALINLVTGITALVKGVDNGDGTCSLSVTTGGAAVATLPTENIKVLASTNPEPVSATDVLFSKGWFYPAKDKAAGVLTPNTGSIYIGKSATYLPDVLALDAGAFLIQAPDGQKFSLKNIYIKGASGDGVFYSVS